MIDVDETNAVDYLRSRCRDFSDWPQLSDDELSTATAEQLAGGVSNIVLRVETCRRSFVLKQSRKQLRTPIDWFSQVDRIWREVDTLRILAELLPASMFPRVLFEDRDNYLFAMEAVEADHCVWKTELLAGRLDNNITVHVGQLLALVHCRSEGRKDLLDGFDDRTVFDELRLDPFYRYVAVNTPDTKLAASLQQLISETLERHDCLVLGDFSPKNILLTSSGPVAVDFETAHLGDPAFDIGFFLSHLFLKAFYHIQRSDEVLAVARTFWEAYRAAPDAISSDFTGSGFEARCVRHLGACLLSRVDGKSRVDYLHDPRQIDGVRSLCRTILTPEHTVNPQTMESCLRVTVRQLCQ